MCGIFGAVFLSHDISVDVDAALTSLAHRGPDARGVLRGDDFVLGHTRLAVLDLTEAGAQPMGDTELALVFNGEIYNHHALRKELVAKGHTFRSRTDTEVILEGYRAWGDRIVEKLDGMFAFAIVDRARQRVLLARDRAGKKPLFYHLQQGALWFASEIKALRAAGLTLEPDLQALPALLTFGYVPPPRTMLQGVSQLPPAHTLTLEGDTPQIQRYWRAPFDAPPWRHDMHEASARVRELLDAAIARRLEADVPLGAFLSGGIDSTIIVGAMARLSGRKVRTFSIGFAGDARYDETHYARIAARAFDTEHTEFRVEPSSMHAIDRLVELHDGPFGDSSALPTSIVSMLTRQHVTVALTGDGGDELFCGYTRFLAGEAAERIPTRALQLGQRLAAHLPKRADGRDRLSRVARFLRVASQPLADRMLHWISLFAEPAALIRPELHAELDLDDPTRWHRELFTSRAPRTPIAGILGANFDSYLPYDLLVKADRASMGHGLELRSPFLDTALIEYAARIPDRLKRRGLDTKRVLKHAYRDLIPEAIQKRGKMGFGIPLGAWFRGDLRELVEDNLATGAKLYAWLSEPAVRTLLAEHAHGHADHGHRIWLLLTLERWLRMRAETL